MNQKIADMIEEYQEEKDFYGTIKNEDINKIEKELAIKIPEQYRAFILEYGSGGICGVDIEGIEGELGSSMLQATIRYRELGLASEYIVVYDLGDYVVCMDTNQAGEDSKVYSWERTSNNPEVRYETFDQFLEDYFQEAIDNY
ncbi:SMI1/KNR4 family protein [Listeria sp. FSL L7-1582]|uniref:SMI1/KNR4 family protein n=1 Tax=Listeria portnoyi TaxID=2713504 RepID=UPI00164E0B78|nr:SMI1/KNR4 family protein [Listeria portnoyi]MBC6308205.1 SMI1/KNR4 family protein [Listeria portnoyi]